MPMFDSYVSLSQSLIVGHFGPTMENKQIPIGDTSEMMSSETVPAQVDVPEIFHGAAIRVSCHRGYIVENVLIDHIPSC